MNRISFRKIAISFGLALCLVILSASAASAQEKQGGRGLGQESEQRCGFDLDISNGAYKLLSEHRIAVVGSGEEKKLVWPSACRDCKVFSVRLRGTKGAQEMDLNKTVTVTARGKRVILKFVECDGDEGEAEINEQGKWVVK